MNDGLIGEVMEIEVPSVAAAEIVCGLVEDLNVAAGGEKDTERTAAERALRDAVQSLCDPGDGPVRARLEITSGGVDVTLSCSDGVPERRLSISRA